uniref:Uncharacterized protein n=1 Tax=Panagrolaimus sp. PS1159 TaxID=55785 RepID=A0AC35F0E0_9BILA
MAPSFNFLLLFLLPWASANFDAYVPSTANNSALNILAGTSTRLPDTITLCFQKALFCPSPDSVIKQQQQQQQRGRKKSFSSVFWGPFKSNTVAKKEEEETTYQTTTFQLNSGSSSQHRRHRSLPRNRGGMDSTTNGNAPGTSVNGSTEFEFRPCAKTSNGGNIKEGSGAPPTRSKSPSAILGRFTNFARGKYRSSMHERSAISTSDDKQRRDVARELQKCRENSDHRLDLNSSDLTAIPPAIKDLTQLTELFLYKNKLSTLPPEIGTLVNLKLLGLSENNLSSLPDTLVNLKNLSTLDLRHNKLCEQIPQVIFKLESVETLWLRYNKVS